MAAALPPDALNAIFRHAVGSEPATYAGIVLCCRAWRDAATVPWLWQEHTQTLREYFLAQMMTRGHGCPTHLTRQSMSDRAVRYLWSMHMAIQTKNLALVQLYADFRWTSPLWWLRVHDDLGGGHLCAQRLGFPIATYSARYTQVILTSAAQVRSTVVMNGVLDMLRGAKHLRDVRVDLYERPDKVLEHLEAAGDASGDMETIVTAYTSPHLAFPDFCPCQWLVKSTSEPLMRFALQEIVDLGEAHRGAFADRYNCDVTHTDHLDAIRKAAKKAASLRQWNLVKRCAVLVSFSWNIAHAVMRDIAEAGPAELVADPDLVLLLPDLLSRDIITPVQIRNLFLAWAENGRGAVAVQALLVLRNLGKVNCADLRIMKSWHAAVRKQLTIWRREDTAPAPDIFAKQREEKRARHV